MFGEIQGWIIPVVIIVVAVVLIFLMGYRKARPDQALIISGVRRKAKVVIGKAAIKLPFLERCDVLDLALMSVDVRTQTSIPSGDYINVKVDSVVNVKISPEKEIIEKRSKTS